MRSNEWSTVDKTSWGPGPWQDEPDKVHWIDPATDYDCLMVRGPSGAWCGYVAVTEGHAAFEMDYEKLDNLFPDGEDGWSTLSVHGGLTFAGFCAESEDPSKGVCHVPAPGRPHRVWWLGFDCAHAGDYAPGHRHYVDIRGEEYRDRAYVEDEVRSLARQLAEMSGDVA